MDENNDFLKQKNEDENKASSEKKTKKKNVAAEIKTDEAVETVEVVAVDMSKIENALITRNITQEALQEMRDTFLTLKINGIEDKDGYKLVEEKRKFVKKVRSLTVTVCKAGREGAIAEQKAWISKEKEVTGQLIEIEKYLEEQTAPIDEEKARIKEEETRKLESRIQNRTARLINLGMKLINDKYILGEHVIDTLHVKAYDDFTFESLVTPVENEAKRIAEEKAIEDAKLKALQEEQEAQRLQLAKERAELDAAKKKADEEAAAQKKAMDEQQAKLVADQKALADAKTKARKTSLFALGLSQQHEKLVFHEIGVGEDEIAGLDETQWLSLLHHITEEVTKVKARIETETKAKIEADKKAAVDAERKRLEDEQKAKDDAAAKAKADAEAKAKKDEEEKLRLAALAPDQEKFDLFIKNVQDLIIPDFATDDYKAFGAYMKETRDKMVNHFNKEKLTRIK